jgi:hypothetical protein
MMDVRAAPWATAGNIPCTSTAFAELGREVLGSGRALRFRAQGGSMAPLVRDGDVVLVRPVDSGSIRVGDVLLCLTPGCPSRGVVLHRLVRREAGPQGVRFTVQGDRLARPDGTIPAAQVCGRVAAIERAGTRIQVDGPAMRALGRLAALRSRSKLGRGMGFRLAGRLVRKLPGLSRYLA